MRTWSLAILLALGGLSHAYAQDPAPTPTVEVAHAHHHHNDLMTRLLGISRTRLGSGTSWLPDSSPMYCYMGALGSGGYMVHGNIFAGYDAYNSNRGSGRFLSVNSIMGMLWHPVASGELLARVMLSAEPLTIGTRGYPLILQTGETRDDQLLHDSQHAHELFMELALDYTFPITDKIAVELYVAAAGEPALGPTAFPHRVAAMADPIAPITHHWQDSTHISFGVLTAGVYTRELKLEFSWFNGREPDEQRWDMDLRVPDSFATRLSWNPTNDLSMQASYAYLKSPEWHDVTVSAHRATTSLLYNRRTGSYTNWATTVVFGMNAEVGGSASPSALVESSFAISENHLIFGRAEYVRKSAHDLVLPTFDEQQNFDVGNLALGYVFYFPEIAALNLGIGARGSVSFMGASLESAYGTRVPVGGMIYVQLRPAIMRH